MRSSNHHKGFISKVGCFSQRRENRIKHWRSLTNAECATGLEKPGSAQEHPGAVWSMAKGKASAARP